VAVNLQFCYNDWVLIEENKNKGKFIKSRGHFRLPNCTTLPRYDPNEKKCSYIGLVEMKKEEVSCKCSVLANLVCLSILLTFFLSDECRIGIGKHYLGKVNVTNTGLSCQRWDSQEPHAHFRPPMVFPELQNAENYCRNAGGEEPQPWCYTTDKSVRWQHCEVPKCYNLSE